MTYQQLIHNYIESTESYTPNWADPCGIACNPCNPTPPWGTCGTCPYTGAFTACNGDIYMNPCSPIIDASAPPPPPPCPPPKCRKKKCKVAIGCVDPCAQVCINPCLMPPPCIPYVKLDPCLNPWIKNIPWLQRTWGGRYAKQINI